MKRLNDSVFYTMIFAVVVAAGFHGCGTNSESTGAGGDPAPTFADLVLTNADVVTIDSTEPSAEAVAVLGDTIIYVGDAEDVSIFVGPGTNVRDLEGQTLLPGFIDAHIHPGVAALLGSLGVNAAEASSLTELQEMIRDYDEANPDALAITGFGLQGAFSAQAIQRSDLDAAVADKPVFIVDGGGHAAVANSRALDVLNITPDTPDPFEGAHFFGRDELGEPTGQLFEGTAFWPFLRELGVGTREQFEKAFPLLLPDIAAAGVTSVFDAGTPDLQEEAMQALRVIEDRGDLTVRYFASNYVLSREDAQRVVAETRRLQETYTSELVSVAAVKFSNDGVAPPGTPMPFHVQFRQDELASYYTNLAAANINIMVHATVGLTISESLAAWEQALSDNPSTTARLAVAHANGVQPADAPRFAAAGIIANLQLDAGGAPVDPDAPLEEIAAALGLAGVDALLEAAGTMGGLGRPATEEEVRELLRSMGGGGGDSSAATLFGADAMVTLSSDFPAAPSLREAGPIEFIAGAAQIDGVDVLTLIETLTLNGATQVGREADLGSIEVGKLADLVILSASPLTVSLEEIGDIEVVSTIVGGRIVFDRR